MRAFHTTAAPLALAALLAGAPVLTAQQDSETITRTFTVGAGAELIASNLAGDIVVTAGATGEILIEATKTGTASGRARVDVALEQTGNRVEVRARYPQRSGNDRVRVAYDIRVPPDAMVFLKSISGDLQVTGIGGVTRLETVSGDIHAGTNGALARAKSVSGDIVVTGGAADRDLELESVSGSVDARDLAAPRLEVSTVSGDVDLASVTGDNVDVQTVSGDVVYRGRLGATARLALRSHSGDVEIDVEDTSGFDLEASSFSGRIRTDASITLAGVDSDGRRRRSLEGRFGAGGARLDLSTFSGDIVVGRRN